MLLMERYTLYNEKFQQLDHYLSDLQNYWRFEAFHHSDYPWARFNPALSDFLDALSEQQFVHYQQFPESLYLRLTAFINPLRSLQDSLFVINKIRASESEVPFWLTTGIKGRKCSQIAAFATQINNAYPVLEWCAGKGHLGRLISWQQTLPVTSIEWQQKLCDLGEAEATKMQISQVFKQADILKGQADNCVTTNKHCITCLRRFTSASY